MLCLVSSVSFAVGALMNSDFFKLQNRSTCLVRLVLQRTLCAVSFRV